MTEINTKKVTPGDIVVSFNDIVDVLKTKLTKAELDDLIRGIVSKRKPEVFPGDLITADMINGILADLADLQLRLSKLETPSAPTVTQITGLLPSSGNHIGDQLHIIGQGFDAPDGTIVTIDDIRVAFSYGADRDRELIVTIPNVQGVLATGRNITVLVSNTNGTDTRDFVVFPAVETIPHGQVFVTCTQRPPDKLLAGQKYVFIYNVQAVTDLEETYTLAAKVDEGWEAQIVDASNNPISPAEISLPAVPPPAGATQSVRVQVLIPAGTADKISGLLRLTVTSKRNPNQLFGYSGGEPIPVNAEQPWPDTIRITLDKKIIRSSADQPKAVIAADGRVKIGPAVGNYTLTFNAQIKANTIYNVQLKAIDPLWSQSLSGPGVALSQNMGPFPADINQPISVILSAAAGAPDTNLVLTVTSTTDAKQIGHVNQPIGLLP